MDNVHAVLIKTRDIAPYNSAQPMAVDSRLGGAQGLEVLAYDTSAKKALYSGVLLFCYNASHANELHVLARSIGLESALLDLPPLLSSNRWELGGLVIQKQMSKSSK